MAIFGGSPEMMKKQFIRFLRHRTDTYFVESQADALIKYAKDRGVVIKKTVVNVGYSYAGYNMFVTQLELSKDSK